MKKKLCDLFFYFRSRLLHLPFRTEEEVFSLPLRISCLERVKADETN